MKTEWLSEWEVLVIQKAVEELYSVNEEQKEALAKKLSIATHIRLSYKDTDPAIQR